jgi:RNA polymerase sigma factor (sigma-70 family)
MTAHDTTVRPTGAEDAEVAGLVRAAAEGDQGAWESLVRRYVALLWRIAFRHGLNESDAADVVQSTWLKLLEHIDDVREPARVGSWLSTTAQRESLRHLAHHKRFVPSDDPNCFDRTDLLQPSLDEGLIRREQAATAVAALETLPSTWKALMRLLSQDPTPSYEQIGDALGVPVGSIGPTRGRCVRRLRAILVA